MRIALMRRILISRRQLLAGATVVVIAPLAQPQIPERRVRIPPDDLRAMRSFTDTISDFEAVSYAVTLRAGQWLHVTLATDNAANCFDIHAPGTERPVYVGGESGNRHDLEALVDGEHVVRVYLLRFAARDGQSARYTLELKVTG